MPQSTIPQAVIEKDHELEGRTERAGEALAKHRWRQTLDPTGPRYSIREYAKGIGRSHLAVQYMVNGYAAYVDQPGNAALTDKRSLPKDASLLGKRSLADMIALERTKVEDRAFVEAIAEGSGETVQRVAGSGRRTQLAVAIGRAKDRAERRGTDAVDEARDIARAEAKASKSRRARAQEERERHTIRYVHIEGDLAYAQRKLMHALREAEGVGFTDEEMELLRDSIATVRALLDLIDLRMAGTPDIDWDAELAGITGGGS